jgi:hypothetical protein
MAFMKETVRPTDTYTYFITVMGVAGNIVKQEGSFMLFR